MGLLLFFSVSNSVHAAASTSSKIADSPEWHALLHLNGGRPQVEDPKFYVNGKFEGAEAELEASANLFSGPSRASWICRFPARAVWLEKNGIIAGVDLSSCRELKEFLLKAPLDTASLVFASEKISHPVTMMGHVFLKLWGRSEKGFDVAHAVSFFTDINGGNFPALVYQSLISGKQGYYTLSPYEPVRNEYVVSEQRNLWEYDLSLNDEQRTRLHLHLFELKSIAFRYYFVQFNCATLIRNIVAVAIPEIMKEDGFWVTPLDTVRAVDRQSQVSARRFLPSSRWRIKAVLSEQRPKGSLVSAIGKRQFESESFREGDGSERFLSYELALAYNDWQYEQGGIAIDDWRSARDLLKGKSSSTFADGVVDFSSYKKPSLSINDSQVALSHLRDGTTDIFRVGFLAASHALEDDTSQYTSESELKIGDIKLEYLPTEGRLRVASAMIFSAISFQSTDSLAPTWSGKLRFGYEPLRMPDLSLVNSYVLQAALGKTLRIFGDIDVYWMGFVAAQMPSEFYVSAGPEVGMIVREIFRMKSILSFQRSYFGPGARCSHCEMRPWEFPMDRFSFRQAVAFGDYSLVFGYASNWLPSGYRLTGERSEVDVTLKYLF